MGGENLEQKYDVLIVGGGIVGAGVFRDLALNNVKTLIIDQGDFASQTSQGSSKMLHGGIRYLENFDFALVFEALREKNLWLKLTPYLSREVPFYLPVYKESKWPLFFLRIGLFLYDLLSLFKNSTHRILNKEKTLKEFPGLKSEGLRGSGMYYDGIVDDSKLALDCLYDGLRYTHTEALNYMKIESCKFIDGIYHSVLSSQTEEEKKITIRSKKVIFATGPFTDIVMKKLDIPWEPVIQPSKGVHLWVSQEKLPIKDAMVLQLKDGRIIFVIPQRKAVLVGTTETPLKRGESIQNIEPDKEDLEYLLNAVKEYFPESNLTLDDIISSFAAVRPLVKAPGTKSSKLSRKHQIYSPNPGQYVLVGGKYTTFRKMAEDLNKIVMKDLGLKYNAQLSKRSLNAKSLVVDGNSQSLDLNTLKEIIKKEKVKTREDLIYRRLSLLSEDYISEEESKESLQKVMENTKLL